MQVTATISNGTNTYAVEALANYVVFAPQFEPAVTTTAIPNVGPHVVGNPQTWAQLGAANTAPPGVQPTGWGMNLVGEITVPQQSNGGYLAFIQTISSQSSAVNASIAYPSTPPGTYDADTCVPIVAGFLAPGKSAVHKYDSPGILLTGAPTSAPNATITLTDSFQDWWMWLPSGVNSIWVPLVNTSQSGFSVTAQNNGTNWFMKSNSPAPSKVPAAHASAVPTWNAVFEAGSSPCPSLPTPGTWTAPPAPTAAPTISKPTLPPAFAPGQRIK